MNSIDVYETKIESEIHPIEEQKAPKIKFYFESIGSQKVIKAIEYSCLGFNFLGRSVYNLGFGDYDPITGDISDVSVSNNGDVYKVFNTVLHTVFVSFDKVPDGVIFVQGSDSDADFFDKCIPTCRKRCVDKCKNGDRRISIYREYINKNYG